MGILEAFYKQALEGVLFLVAIILLFNLLTDFAYKLGIVSEILQISEIQYYGFLASFLAVLNIISHKFFGFKIVG